jgi:hypothetical protein
MEVKIKEMGGGGGGGEDYSGPATSGQFGSVICDIKVGHIHCGSINFSPNTNLVAEQLAKT